jgi:hypothetical protein
VELFLHSPNTPSCRGAQFKKSHRDRERRAGTDLIDDGRNLFQGNIPESAGKHISDMTTGEMAGIRTENLVFGSLIHQPASLEISGPFQEFVDSPYYSESDLCGDAVTVSFSKYFH